MKNVLIATLVILPIVTNSMVAHSEGFTEPESVPNSELLASVAQIADEGERFTSCDIELGDTGISRKVDCAYIAVPLSADSSQTIDISVLRLPAKSKKIAEDPVLMLAGGPGQAASEAYLFADRQFDKLSWNRDIYLIDQRGTGRSELFQCQQLIDSMFEPDAQENADLDKVASLSRECLDDFPYDARFFTTSAAISDFELVREALGVAQWNLFGVSYGTRIAQHYVRMHPSAIRSVVIDSVVHPDHNLGLEVAFQSQRALDMLIVRCEQSQVCNETFPDFSSGVEALMAQLRGQPIDVAFEDLRTGQTQSMRLGFGHLALVLRMSLYTDESAALIPLLFHEAYADSNFAPLARKANSISGMVKGLLAMGMHNSVICTEDVAFFNDVPGDNEFEKREGKDTYLGEDLIDFLRASCSVWPQGVLDENFKAPVNTDVPVLLLSGEYDPITPPEYADRAMVEFSRARHFVVPGQGHNVSTAGCAPTLVAKFINELLPEQLDGSCLQRLKPAPFFIDFNGPKP